MRIRISFGARGVAAGWLFRVGAETGIGGAPGISSCSGHPSTHVRAGSGNLLEFGPAKAHIRIMKGHSSITVIVAVLIIVVSMAFLFRWHVVSSSIGLQRIDRWTGHLQICNLVNGKIICVDE
jgi:hypothetical protein